MCVCVCVLGEKGLRVRGQWEEHLCLSPSIIVTVTVTPEMKVNMFVRTPCSLPTPTATHTHTHTATHTLTDTHTHIYRSSLFCFLLQLQNTSHRSLARLGVKKLTGIATVTMRAEVSEERQQSR